MKDTGKQEFKPKRVPEIRLNHSRFAHAYGLTESLWEEEISRMLDLIEKHVDALPENSDYVNDQYSTDHAFLSIGLFGTYGAGKSSLMKTFYNRVNDKNEGYLNTLGHPGLRERIFCLPVIEPNLQNKDDQFLYAFLAQALEADMQKHKKKYETYRDTQILSPVQQKFHEISEYLQVLDNRESRSEYDPLGISLERLERHSSGLRLCEKMNEFLSILAESLCGAKEKSAVLLLVDDSDMSLDGLVSTLDAVRRYLQHPRLVPIFTFTGRLAEELLQTHFEEKLTMNKNIGPERLREASTKLSITENLAIQYLSKLFPVRNRIKLGPAAARVHNSVYFESRGENQEAKKAFLLLETASRIMFGCPEWNVTPTIQSPLRSSTLRRQLHILDAMQAANVGDWMPDDKQKGPMESRITPQISWAQMFDRATWALLNVHRDVLKEYHLNIDDLYSWTPMGLRQVVLISILEQPKEQRRLLIKQWRYRTEDRRSQMLSLLAANIFRPKMFEEENTGDDPIATSAIHQETEEYLDPWKKRSFAIQKGSIWFFQLWLGFYLPQILARNRKNGSEIPVDGVGWNLVSGPVHAIREALINKNIYSTGMLFLDPAKFAEQSTRIVQDANALNRNEDKSWETLILQIWSYYGHHNGGTFAAISLWRGMGLMSLLLQSEVDYFLSGEYHQDKRANGNLETENGDSINVKRKERITAIIYRHLQNAHILGTPNSQPEESNKFIHTTIDKKLLETYGKWRIHDLRTPINKLAGKVITWLDKFPLENYRIQPMAPTEDHTIKKAQNYFFSPTKRDNWKACFVRRVHGGNILSHFWESLDNIGEGELGDEWNSRAALTKWCGVLANYWDCGKEFDPDNSTSIASQNMTQSLLMLCPFVEPFAISEAKLDKEITRCCNYLDKLKTLIGKNTLSKLDNPSKDLFSQHVYTYLKNISIGQTTNFDEENISQNETLLRKYLYDLNEIKFNILAILTNYENILLRLKSYQDTNANKEKTEKPTTTEQFEKQMATKVAVPKRAEEQKAISVEIPKEEQDRIESIYDSLTSEQIKFLSDNQIEFLKLFDQKLIECTNHYNKYKEIRKKLRLPPGRPIIMPQVATNRSKYKFIKGKLSAIHTCINHLHKEIKPDDFQSATKDFLKTLPNIGWHPIFGVIAEGKKEWVGLLFYQTASILIELLKLKETCTSYSDIFKYTTVPKAKNSILAYLKQDGVDHTESTKIRLKKRTNKPAAVKKSSEPK